MPRAGTGSHDIEDAGGNDAERGKRRTRERVMKKLGSADPAHPADRRLPVLGAGQAEIDRVRFPDLADLIGRLRFSTSDGRIWLAEHRMLLIHAKAMGSLRRELEAARRSGLEQTRLLDGVPGAPFETGPCLVFEDQAQFQPLDYILGLAAAIERRGGRIATGQCVREVEGGRPARLRIDRGPTVTARTIVVATNAPISLL